MRWLIPGTLFIIALIGWTMSTVAANPMTLSEVTLAQHLRRCENNYDDDELAAMREDGEDAYEPDDCPLLAHVLTGPMLLNFCQPGDADWVKFKAEPNLLYQLRASPPWNYPTEPRLELYVDGVLVAANDHYFDRDAEIWWWNSFATRMVDVRIFEFAGRHDCGNSAYTLTLNSFSDNPYPTTPVPTSTPTPTATLTATTTITATATAISTETPAPSPSK
jgi:hypothetical protein